MDRYGADFEKCGLFQLSAAAVLVAAILVYAHIKTIRSR
jgi:hypothetical protein